MIELIIDNSECQVKNLPNDHLSKLKKILSYQISANANYYTGYHNPTRYLIDKRGVFPTGLLYLVKRYIKENEVSVSILDRRTKPKINHNLFKLTLPFKPYKEQHLAVESLKSYSRGIIAAPTGAGKSVIIAMMINYLQVPTLVIVPSLELKRQLTKSLKDFFGETKDIVVENIDSADNIKRQFDCIIIDEFHHSAASTYRKLNKKMWNSTFYKYGLTATPFRSQDNERLLLESVLSKIIYKIEYTKAVEAKMIVPVEAFFIEVPKTIPKGNTGNWAAMYSELVVNNEVRNEMISVVIKKLQKANISTLTLIKEINHGNNLRALTGVPFINGEEQDNIRRIVLLEYLIGLNRSLIGTFGVMGEGVDTKPCEIVIVAGLGKSKNAFMQQVGRAFRTYEGKTSAKVIIFKDRSHKWCLNHFREQCKILRTEYGIEPQKLSIDFEIEA